MNTWAYDYPQTLEISKQHVHKSLCGNSDGGDYLFTMRKEDEDKLVIKENKDWT